MEYVRAFLDVATRFLSALVPAVLAYLASKERGQRQQAEAEAERLSEVNAILKERPVVDDVELRKRMREQQRDHAGTSE